jgi:hypothetical protein
LRSMFEASSGQNRGFDEFGSGESPTEPMIPIVLTPNTQLSPHTLYPQHRQPQQPANLDTTAAQSDQSQQPQFVSSPQSRRSSVPVIVGVAFVCVQLILLARVVLMLFGADSSVPWIAWVYILSGGFALPFKLLIEQAQFPAQVGSEIVGYVPSLLAILVYGLISRVLVRFLKAFLNSR